MNRQPNKGRSDQGDNRYAKIENFALWLRHICGVVTALLLAFSLSHSGGIFVLLAYLAPVPLFMAGMGLGPLFSLIAAIVGGIVLAALSPSSFDVFYLFSDALPAVALIYMTMRSRVGADGKTEWSGEGNILTLLATYPCLMFLGIYAATMGHDGGLQAMTLEAFNGMGDQVSAMLSENGQAVTPEMNLKMHQYFEFCARITPALAMCAWLFSTLIAMAAAQGLLQQRKWNLRPQFSLNRLHVPNWVIFAAAVTGLAGTYAPAPYDYIGLNLALVLGVPFFFVGLAIIHAWAAQTKRPTLVLIIFYTVISIIVHFVLLVAILGAVDQWVDFRKRFAGRTLN